MFVAVVVVVVVVVMVVLSLHDRASNALHEFFCSSA